MEEKDEVKKLLQRIHKFSNKEEKMIEVNPLSKVIQDIESLALNNLKREIEETISSQDLSEEKKTEYIKILNIEKNKLLKLT